jgi:hypothetical protein
LIADIHCPDKRIQYTEVLAAVVEDIVVGVLSELLGENKEEEG